MALKDNDAAPAQANDKEPCDCARADVHAALCDLFDGHVDPRRAAEIRAELAACPECFTRLRSEETVRLIMRRCGSSEAAPTEVRQRITAQLRITRF